MKLEHLAKLQAFDYGDTYQLKIVKEQLDWFLGDGEGLKHRQACFTLAKHYTSPDGSVKENYKAMLYSSFNGLRTKVMKEYNLEPNVW